MNTKVVVGGNETETIAPKAFWDNIPIIDVAEFCMATGYVLDILDNNTFILRREI